MLSATVMYHVMTHVFQQLLMILTENFTVEFRNGPTHSFII